MATPFPVQPSSVASSPAWTSRSWRPYASGTWALTTHEDRWSPPPKDALEAVSRGASRRQTRTGRDSPQVVWVVSCGSSTSVVESLASHDAGVVGVLHLAHLGHRVGDVDERVGCIATGGDDAHL